MNKTQLDQQTAQKIVDDNPQYRFLTQLLPLYDRFKRSRRASGKSELKKVYGMVVRENRHKQLLINRETFYVDESDYVVLTVPETETAWYLGVHGCDKPDDIINFHVVKNHSSYTQMFYELNASVPRPHNLEYLQLGN